MANLNNFVYMWIVVAANRSTLIQFKILSGVLMFLHSHCGDPFVIYVIYAQSSLELTGGIVFEY